MMRKILIISGCLTMAAVIVSCRAKDNPGRVYMPDMFYSRAYETYAAVDTSVFTSDRDSWSKSDKSKIFYNREPVAGTMARGEMAAYPYKNDTTGYKLSAGVKNPLDLASIDMKEAQRLYLVNCGICHGPKLDGNGPLWKDGNGPYPAAPKNFKADDMKAMPEGTMFHSVTFGKGMMGSYASQLSTPQRWMVIAYIKKEQGGAAKPATDTTGNKPAGDTAKVALASAKKM